MAYSKTDAEFCGKVPLHQTNLIQPHGCLVVVDQINFQIIQASENCPVIFNRQAEDLVGASLTSFIPQGELSEMQARIQAAGSRLPVLLTITSQTFLTLIKSQDGFFILEISLEPLSGRAHSGFMEVYQHLKFVMASLEQATSTKEASEIVVRELKTISGFDKVMMYQFDEGWNGEVIAEAKAEGMESYLGLKFPASDVPKQARDLYKNTAYRLIPDVDYQPIKLYPVINPVTHTFTNLSDSNLRSVAPVHLEYLRNMNVRASMSTRVLNNEVLWGLISCHHRAPKFLSFEMCSVFELLSYSISSKITALQNMDAFTEQTALQQQLMTFTEQLYTGAGLPEVLRQNEESLLQLLRANGIAVLLNNQVIQLGKTPDVSDIQDLAIWIQASTDGKVYHQSALPLVYEPAAQYQEYGSGIMVLPVRPDSGDYIIAFRPEAVQEVNWGGNPNEAIRFEEDGVRYHPRASFQQWKQRVTQTAIPWSNEELAMAERFRRLVAAYVLNQSII